LITLTLLGQRDGAAPAETVKDFPEQIRDGEMLWVDAESPTEEELGELKERSTRIRDQSWKIMGRMCSL